MFPSRSLLFTEGRRAGAKAIKMEELDLPSSTAILRRAVHAPPVGSTVELTLDVGIVGDLALEA